MVNAAMQYLREHPPFTVSAKPQAAEGAPDRPLSPQEVAAEVVQVTAAWLDERRLDVRVSILSGFHINANQPAKGLVPTQVIVGHEGAAEVAGVDYPPGEEQRFAFTDETVRAYSGDVSIVVNFKSPMTGGRAVRLSLQHQACDDNACLAPVTKQIEVNTP